MGLGREPLPQSLGPETPPPFPCVSKLRVFLPSLKRHFLAGGCGARQEPEPPGARHLALPCLLEQLRLLGGTLRHSPLAALCLQQHPQGSFSLDPWVPVWGASGPVK